MKKGSIMFMSLCFLLIFSQACEKKTAVIKENGGGPVLAKVNDTEITLSDFNERLKEYPSIAHGGTVDLETKKGFLDNLIVRELLYQEAIHNGLDKEKETAVLLEEMKKRILVDRFFKKELEENAYKQAVRQVKAFFMLDKIAQDEKIYLKEEEIEEYIEGLAAQHKKTKDEIRSYLEKGHGTDELAVNMRNKKVMEFLLKEAKIE